MDINAAKCDDVMCFERWFFRAVSNEEVASISRWKLAKKQLAMLKKKKHLTTHVTFPFEPQLESSPCRGCCAAKIRWSCEKALTA